MIKHNRYNFNELVEQANNFNSTTEERMQLWYWFSRYGSMFWNGECYKIDKETDLYPIYEETVDEDGEIEYGDVIDCEVR